MKNTLKSLSNNNNRIGFFPLKYSKNYLMKIPKLNFSDIFKDKEAAEEKIYINKEESKISY